MNEDSFIQARRPLWDALQDMLNHIGKRGLAHLPPEEIKRFGALYQAAAADLARARSRFPGGRTSTYLNKLVVRAVATIYRPRPMDVRQMWHFFGGRFQGYLRRHLTALLFIACLLFGAAGAGFVVETSAPGAARAVFSGHVLQRIERKLAQGDTSGANWKVAVRPHVAARILTNNIQVSMLAFGAGLFFGVGTAIIVLFNGLLLGLLAAVFHSFGQSIPFWAHILPHGVIELAAVILAGCSGLVLGRGFLRPGTKTRLAALRASAREGMTLFLGCIPLLVVAAAIEGFVTPSTSLPDEVKLLFAALTVLPLWWFFFGVAPKD